MGWSTDFGADKSRIVEEGNYHKFTKAKSNPDMLRMLLDTGDRELVEVSVLFPCWLSCNADRNGRPRQLIVYGA